MSQMIDRRVAQPTGVSGEFAAKRGPSQDDAGTPPRGVGGGSNKPPALPKPPATRVTRIDPYPAGLVHTGLTRPEAYHSYDRSIAADWSREAAIYVDPANDEFIVIQGTDVSMTGWSYLPDLRGRRWRLVEHYHPLGDRLPSGPDFHDMMLPQLQKWIPQQPVSSKIRWQDPVTKIFFHTDFGYGPDLARPYWVQCRGINGRWQHVTFENEPWAANSDYQQWFGRTHRRRP
jgi:hypothetical protein